MKPYQAEERIKVPRFEEAAGFYTTARQSEIMSRIRSKNSRAEVAMRKVLWNFGHRYRLHHKNLPGKPDIVFSKWKIAIFIDGDFWHGNDWENKRQRIKSNREFWIPKIERNIQRDREVDEQLAKMGWHCLRIWEREIKKDFGASVMRALRFIEFHSGEPDSFR